MPFLLLALGRFWPYILAAVLMGFLAYKANHWCNSSCQDATVRAVKAEGQIREAQQRATDIALLWSATVDKSEAKARETEKRNELEFSRLKEVARRIAADNPGRLSPAAIQLSDDSRVAASAGATAIVAETAPAPASSTEEFIVQMYEWAAVCRSRVEEWQTFYNSLRSATNE